MQRTLRIRHKPPPVWAQRAREYAQQLYIQFGLRSDEAPDVARNARFADYFK
jgi:hypothetical protein